MGTAPFDSFPYPHTESAPLALVRLHVQAVLESFGFLHILSQTGRVQHGLLYPPRALTLIFSISINRFILLSLSITSFFFTHFLVLFFLFDHTT